MDGTRSDSYLLPELEEGEDVAVPLPSSLLKMKKMHLDIRNSHINSSASQTIARLKEKSQAPNNNFSLFDFNPIAKHKATSHKWSKLTALPHIADQRQPGDGNLMELDFHGNLFDPVSKEHENAEDLSQWNDKALPGSPIKMEGREQGTLGRHKPMNMGNVMIEFNPLSEQKLTPPSKFASKPVPNNSDSRLPVNSISIGNAGTMRTSPTTSNVPIMGHKMTPSNRGHVEHFSTINIGNSLPSKDNRTLITRGLEKRMSDLQNAVLINNWIKILESTKEDGNISISRPSGASHQHAVGISAASIPVTNRYVPTMPFSQKQRTMASVDLSKFFNVSQSVLMDFDRHKQQNNSNFHKQLPSHVHPADLDIVYTGGAHLRPEKRPPMANANVSAVDPSVSMGQHHKSISYRRWLPRLNVEGGLTDLLAIQRLETGVQMDGHDTGITSHDTKSHNSRSGEVALEGHPMLHSHNLDQADLQSENRDHHSKRQLKIKVNIPREIGESVAVKPLLKLSPRVDNTGSKRGYSETGNPMFGSNTDRHVDDLLFRLPFPERKLKGNQHSIKRNKVRKMRQNPFLTYTDRKEVPLNAFPELSVVGSSMLDTSELAWKEEAKALIIQMLEGKGMCGCKEIEL